MSATETLTILRATHGGRLAKIISPGHIRPYDNVKYFDAMTVSVGSLDDIADVLRTLIDNPSAAVIRGELANGATAALNIRRLLHPDRKTGEEATLRECPHRWIALDVDSVARPHHVPADDLTSCAHFAVTTLPAAFHDARCVVQATASHGIKPGVRLRLWYWLDRPVSCAELKRWLARTRSVDVGSIGPVNLIYTARPIFLDGAVDPLPGRLS
jgi:hypothetical protein